MNMKITAMLATLSVATPSACTGTIHMYENDTGPDDANHAQEGIFIWKGAKQPVPQALYSIYDIAPTILRYFNIAVPEEMIGSSMI